MKRRTKIVKVKRNPFTSFWTNDAAKQHANDIISGWDNSTADEDYKPRAAPVDLIQLASYRRAVSNFVTIVTGRNDIPVKFRGKGKSYTDGKSVVIGSKINEKNFDHVVGLALHEGSHIKLTDFDLLHQLSYSIPQETYNRGAALGFDSTVVHSHVKNMWNYVEDKRIDNYVYTTAPGYRGYYQAMYDKFFNSRIIDKGLKSAEYRTATWNSYMFRIVNLTNKNTDLTALPQLREIKNLIFGSIRTMDSSDESLAVAFKVYDIILDNISKAAQEAEKNQETEDGEGEGDGEGGEGSGNGTFDPDNDPVNDDGSIDPNAVIVAAPPGGEPGPTGGNIMDPEKLTDNQKEQLKRAIAKQEKFNNGEVSKQGALSQADQGTVATMESDVDQVKVGEGVRAVSRYSLNETIQKGIKAVYVKRLTQSMIDNDMFRDVLRRRVYEPAPNSEQDFLGRGISLGTRLGKKLNVRGDSRELKWNRLNSGRIDKRLISELGFGNSQIFQTTTSDAYADAFLHISVDASGSMVGSKWTKTMTTVVAICKAVDMIAGVDVVVSFRSTHSVSHGYGDYRPLVMVAYDSRIDKFTKVKKHFKHIHPGGSTPEGLCFETTMENMVSGTRNLESYFLNLSDGMPMFGGPGLQYGGEGALEHTRKQVGKIRAMGIEVLSYFIADGGDYNRTEQIANFKTMYGNDAEFIDVTNMAEIGKTMNKKFLQK